MKHTLSKNINVPAVKGFDYISAQDLLNQPPPQPSHLVENLLTPGLTILAAAPKSGKSYLLTHILAHVCRGTQVFLKRRTRKSKVLYMGLEDGMLRFHKRLIDFIEKDPMGTAYHLDDFLIVTESEATGPDFVKQLQAEITSKDIKVIVIDILHKIFDPKSRFGYAAQYDLMSSLQKCAEVTGTAIIVVHHTNKRARGGLNSISGSSGLTAAADNIIIMNKSSESWQEAYIKLDVQGRDIDPQEIWLEHNLSGMGYVEMAGAPISPNRRKDLKLIAELRQQGKTQQEIADELGKSQATISRYIQSINHNPDIIGLTEEKAEKL